MEALVEDISGGVCVEQQDVCKLNQPTDCKVGSGGGTSGRAMAFCLSGPGSNSRWTWLFQFRIAVCLFSLGVWLSLRMSNRIMHTHSSSF